MSKPTLGELPQSINDRNWKSVQQTLDAQDKKIQEQEKRINKLQATVSSFATQLAASKKAEILARASAAGYSTS